MVRGSTVCTSYVWGWNLPPYDRTASLHADCPPIPQVGRRLVILTSTFLSTGLPEAGVRESNRYPLPIREAGLDVLR